MKQDWEIKDFEECIDRIPRTAKIPKKQFLTEGEYPIVSQEDSYINGYWDKFEDLLKVDKPLVVFGDHTKKLKYIDFDFALGADGVKVLLPIKTIDTQFFYYQLQSITLDDLGYARHYRLLKQERIVIPPLEEQKQIVTKLDQCFEAIDKARANTAKNLENAKELFQSKLNDIFSQKGEGWVEKKLGDVCKTGAGGTPLKSKKEYYLNGDIPWLVSGEVKQGNIFKSKQFITKEGLNNSSAKLFPQDTVLVAMYGATAGDVGILRFKSSTNQAVCGILPNDKFLPEFVSYSFQYKKDELISKATGNAQPNISQIKIKNTLIPVLSIKEQNKIVQLLDKLKEQTQSLESKYQQALNSLEELKKSILQKAFEGEL